MTGHATMTPGQSLIRGERMRQISKGYDTAHDRHHGYQGLIDAGLAYVRGTNYAPWQDPERIEAMELLRRYVVAGSMFQAAIDLRVSDGLIDIRFAQNYLDQTTTFVDELLDQQIRMASPDGAVTYLVEPEMKGRSLGAADTEGIRAFMQVMDQEVRHVPTADVSPSERILRVRLVLEEALEFAEAMGCMVLVPDEGGNEDGNEIEVRSQDFEVLLTPRSIDLVEAADALADIVYVTKGSALTLGIDIDAVTAEVQRSNMSKLGADGKPVYNIPGQPTKVGKGPNYTPPLIATSLIEQGWDPGDSIEADHIRNT